MFDLKKVDMKSLRSDVLKIFTMLVVARLIKFWVVDTRGKGGDVFPVFDQDFIYSTAFTLIGFAAFWVLVEPFVREV